MKVITTKYLGPTNYRPSRIKAYADGVKPITVSYKQEYQLSDNHRAVAILLAVEYGWERRNDIVSGQDYNGDFQHVLTPKRDLLDEN